MKDSFRHFQQFHMNRIIVLWRWSNCHFDMKLPCQGELESASLVILASHPGKRFAHCYVMWNCTIGWTRVFPHDCWTFLAAFFRLELRFVVTLACSWNSTTDMTVRIDFMCDISGVGQAHYSWI